MAYVDTYGPSTCYGGDGRGCQDFEMIKGACAGRRVATSVFDSFLAHYNMGGGAHPFSSIQRQEGFILQYAAITVELTMTREEYAMTQMLHSR